MRIKPGPLVLAALSVVVSMIACGPSPEASGGPSARDVDALNAERQQEYPEVSLAEQKAAMQRLEERRRQRRVETLRRDTPPADWIAVAYHGLVLDANLEPITLDDETVSRIQDSMFEVLEPVSRESVIRKHGKSLAPFFNDDRLEDKDRLIARTAVLDSLIEASPPSVRERYAWRQRLLRRDGVDSGEPTPMASHKRLRELLQELDVERASPSVPTPAPTYVEQCRAAGVPIPPDWPDPRWISQGTLAFVFISQGLSAEVFAYRDPGVDGVCYALPRSDGAGVIQLLGIICQSNSTGKACFWDNKDVNNVALTGANLVLDIDTIGNGMTLAENCTSCHRGDNVFNIHPGTALQLTRSGAVGGPYQTDPSVRFTPIAQAGWSNPGPLALAAPAAGQSSCTGCHDLPTTSGQYCIAVLEGAALGTMPPFGTRAGWPPTVTNPKFLDHISALSGCP